MCQFLIICSVPAPEEPLEGGAGMGPGTVGREIYPQEFSLFQASLTRGQHCPGMSGNGKIPLGSKPSGLWCWGLFCAWLARLGPGTARPWHGCPSLAVPRAGLDRVWGSLGWWKGSLPMVFKILPAQTSVGFHGIESRLWEKPLSPSLLLD